MKPLALYDYQQALLDKLRSAIASGHKSIMLYASTGAGKSVMAAALLQACANKGNRCAIVADRRILCEQLSATLDSYRISHGVLMAGHFRFRPAEKIQVCSAQTLEARGDLPNIKLLIIDEAHCTRKQLSEFIQNKPDDICIIGLSATPFTKGLGKLYSCVISAATTDWLVQQNRLAPLKVFCGTEIDMEGAKKVAGEWSMNEAGERGIKITGDIVQEWIKKTHEVFGKPRKTIVFAANVKHAEDLAQQFRAAGFNFLALSYHDDSEFVRNAIKEFSKKDSAIVGLIATDLLTKGFDVPDVMIGVSARPFSKSLSAHIQQMGRVMRSHAGKDFALWLCHSGNFLGFADDWQKIYFEGVNQLNDGAEKARKKLKPKEKKERLCEECGAVMPPKSQTCGHCGHVKAKQAQIIQLPGRMNALSESQVSQEKQHWYSQLLYIGHLRGYKEGWAAVQFKERFNEWPNGLKREAAPVSPSANRWATARLIAYAKAKQKRAAQ